MKLGSEKSLRKMLALIKDDPHISARNRVEQLGLPPRAVKNKSLNLKPGNA